MDGHQAEEVSRGAGKQGSRLKIRRAVGKAAGEAGGHARQNTQRYEGLRAAADAVYQRLKTEAYINRALSDLAGGPAASSMTHRQRGMSALLKEVGAAERQRRDYSREIDLALKNLNVQHAADLAYADAMNDARREAERLQRSRFDAELGLQRDYFELDKKNAMSTRGLPRR